VRHHHCSETQPKGQQADVTQLEGVPIAHANSSDLLMASDITPIELSREGRAESWRACLNLVDATRPA
jgi:hypothetical protein